MERTVTFGKLGDAGQFANQLFHIAAVLGHAERTGARPCLPHWRCHVTGWDYDALYPAIRAHYGDFPGGELYPEPSFAYAPIPDLGHVDLRGNFQCARYFPSDATLRGLFAEPAGTRATLDRFLAEQGLGDFAAIHVRFYAHPTRDKGKGPMEALPLGYYAQALRMLGDDLPVVVVTDNQRLLAAALGVIRPRTELIIPRLPDHLADFHLLTRARRIAIANSSFSWWGAWLGREKERVIAPHRHFWFSREVRNTAFWDPRDLYPPHFREVAW